MTENIISTAAFTKRVIIILSNMGEWEENGTVTPDGLSPLQRGLVPAIFSSIFFKYTKVKFLKVTRQ